MKRILYILGFFLFLNISSFAQDEDNGGKIRERMTEYMQKRLGLSQEEADRFGPVFLNYFKDLKQTSQQYKGDRLLLQQKIVELRLNYRNQFKPIIGEKRSNDVFVYERDFIDEVRRLRQERLQGQNDDRFNKRVKGLLQ